MALERSRVIVVNASHINVTWPLLIPIPFPLVPNLLPLQSGNLNMDHHQFNCNINFLLFHLYFVCIFQQIMYFSNSRTIIFLLLMLSTGTQMVIILSLCIRQSLIWGVPPKFLVLHEGTRERGIMGREWKCHYTAYCRRVILASSLQLLCCFGRKSNYPYEMWHPAVHLFGLWAQNFCQGLHE